MTYFGNPYFKLLKSTFEDLNSCYERGDERFILIPTEQNRDYIIQSEEVWCERRVPPRDWFKDEFPSIIENNSLDAFSLQLPFKLLLDSQQNLVIRHNNYLYENKFPRKKPYIGVIFYNNLLAFPCFDFFREHKEYGLPTYDYTMNCIFSSSYTYEKMRIEFDKIKIKKFVLECKGEVTERLRDKKKFCRIRSFSVSLCK